jgi:hypothetical protein
MSALHRRIIRELIEVVRECDQVDSIEERAQHYENLAERRRESERRTQRAAEQERAEAEDRDYRRSLALQSLKRAEDFGDTWGKERALRELRES